MAEPFIGQLMLVGFNFAPRSWAMCNGQILSIAQNTALFSLLGTQYGGNGQTTFALPDLRGRVPMHLGQGPGLSPRSQGEVGGTENMTLLSTNMPIHNHGLNAFGGGVASSANPTNNALSIPTVPSSGASVNLYSSTAPASPMHPSSVGTAGGNQPFPIMQPFLVLNWVICLEGIFPSRN